MKINEIISEDSKMPKSHISATPGMKKHPNLDNSSPYAPWRFASMFVPSSPDFEHEPDKLGPSGQALVTAAYSKGDHEIIDAAEKKFGTRSVRMTSNGSVEQEDTNKISPTAKRKKNKYGV